MSYERTTRKAASSRTADTAENPKLVRSIANPRDIQKLGVGKRQLQRLVLDPVLQNTDHSSDQSFGLAICRRLECRVGIGGFATVCLPSRLERPHKAVTSVLELLAR